MKEWKYRFKRGLASFLTVGMIASGVSGTTCLPVYAVEGGVSKGDTAATPTPEEELQKLVYAELKNQILDIFSENSSREKAEFTVVIDFPSQGGEKNQKLVEVVSNKASEILDQLMKECSSELFWYNTESTGFEGKPYQCLADRPKGNNGNIITTFEFKLAVKKAYQPAGIASSDATSMSVQTIRNTKNAMSEDGLNQLVESIYGRLKDEISKMVNGESPKDDAVFQLIIDCKNQEVVNALKEKMKASASDIVSRLSRECPSELFWYKEDSDELNGNGKCSNYYTVAPNGSNKNELYFTFFFAVKDEYRVEKGGASSLNANAIQETKKSIDGILDNTDMSDYEILCKYREELVPKYQDKPKQLPHAFQWLCNQTAAFVPSGTKCYTVEGTVDGERHTWNIVTIEGKSYLVDLQNYGLFLVGVTVNAAGGYTVDEKEYVPDKEQQENLPVLEELRYRQKQNFKFVVPDSPDKGIVGAVGDEDIIIEVEGNKGDVKFVSTDPSVATIKDLGNNHAQIHMVGSGETFINALASGSDFYADITIAFRLTVKAADSNSGGGGTSGGGSTGGGTSGGGSTGGGTPGGGSIGGGYMVDDTTTVRELLPQTDFMFHSGTSKIVKSVGAADFTITASGQVKDSTVTYASSDPSVATVDVNTGTVHVVAPGTTKISATASETAIHRAVTYEYELEVQ